MSCNFSFTQHNVLYSFMLLHMCVICSFLLLSSILLHEHTSLFIQFLIDCFQFLAIINTVAKNILAQVGLLCVYVHVCTYVFIFLGQIPKNELTGSYRRYMFSCIRKLSDHFSKWLWHFIFLPTTYESSC